jgi:hypothetical protein
MNFLDRMTDKLAGYINVRSFARDGNMETLLITKTALGWKAKNRMDGSFGVSISSKQVEELIEAMSEVDRPLRVEKWLSKGEKEFKVTRNGKPYSQWGGACEGVESEICGRMRVRPDTAKWASEDGRYVPPIMLSVDDVDAAMESLAEHDAKTGIDRIPDEMWRRLLSGADEVEIDLGNKNDKSDYAVVDVRKSGGHPQNVGIFSLKEVAHLKSLLQEVYEFSKKRYRQGELDVRLMPSNFEALPKPVQDICQGAVRLEISVLYDKYNPMNEEASQIDVTAFDAQGDRTGCCYMDKMLKQAVVDAAAKTDLLVHKSLGIGKSYSQGAEDILKEEFEARVEALKSPKNTQSAEMMM